MGTVPHKTLGRIGTKAANENTRAAIEQLEKRSDQLEVAFQRPGKQMGERPVDETATKAFDVFARQGDDTEIRALQVGDDPSGGYAVTPEFSTRLTAILHDTSPVRNVASVLQTGEDAEGLLSQGKAAEAREVPSSALDYVDQRGGRPFHERHVQQVHVCAGRNGWVIHW